MSEEKDVEKDDMSRVSCSCMGVEYSPIRNEDGSFTERWVCKNCGNQFVKIQFLKELRTRVAELSKDAMFRRINMQVEQIEELQNRLSTLEQSILDLSHPNIKNILSELNQYKSKTVNVVAFHKLEDRLSTLLKASEGMEKALDLFVKRCNERTPNGFKYPDLPITYFEDKEHVKAKQALAEFRAVKETMEKGEGK